MFIAIPCYLLLATIVIIGLFSVKIAWWLLGIALVILLGVCWAFIARNQDYVNFEELTGTPFDTLTEDAAELVRRYWSFYTSPALGIELGGVAAAVALAAIGLGVIGLLEKMWWGLVAGVCIWIVSLRVSARVNPTNRFLDPSQKAVHEEIKAMISESLLKRWEEERQKKGS
jgi:hypothetical protein